MKIDSMKSRIAGMVLGFVIFNIVRATPTPRDSLYPS